jgi:hypothetical protein
LNKADFLKKRIEQFESKKGEHGLIKPKEVTLKPLRIELKYGSKIPVKEVTGLPAMKVRESQAESVGTPMRSGPLVERVSSVKGVADTSGLNVQVMTVLKLLCDLRNPRRRSECVSRV